MSAGKDAHQLSFQLSPIILTDGVAQFTGGMLPIIAITEAINFTTGLLGGSQNLDLNNFFANFGPLAGSTLIDNVYGEYTFANMATAANAVISEPLKISMKMTCPARSPGGFASKLATLTALKTTLALHTNMGGSYTIATPAALYTNCLLRRLSDVSAGQPSQPQSIYQWDFEQPLLTEASAVQAFNGMMAKIAGGLPSTGALSGLEVAGLSSLATGQLVPAASNTLGSGFSSSIPQ